MILNDHSEIGLTEEKKMITINSEECTRCGQCISECPLGLIISETGGVPRPGENIENCIGCGHCVALCPGAAISLPNELGDVREISDLTLNMNGSSIPATQILNLIRQRRSIRNFMKREVDEKILQNIFDSLAWAPTARNGRPVHWTVLMGTERVKGLSETIVRWVASQGGFYTSFAKAWEKGIDAINWSAPCVVVAATEADALLPEVDSTIAMTSFELAAVAHGLGTCWAGITARALRDNEESAEFLDIPRGHRVCSAMMVGYPAVTYRRLPPRKPVPVRWKAVK